MPDAPSSSTARGGVDEAALRRLAVRLQRASEPPWLHGEVARRMAERLAIVKLQPTTVIDWWSRAGGGRDALAAAYPRARRLDVEPLVPAAPVLPWWSPRRWSAPPAPVMADEVAQGQAQLVWSNMMLHAVADPLQTLRQWHGALAVDGFLMFSTLGPGTFPALRALYGEMGWGPPLAPFVDMHDLGDMLVEAGFADPVMDQEKITLTWRNAASALAELRSFGSNAALSRHPGLRTPRWRERLLDGLGRVATRTGDGRIELDLEVVYGHAFKPVPRAKVAAEAHVPLADMRAMVRAGRSRPPS
jgi:malonyl-CoA O-methyltransferase